MPLKEIAIAENTQWIDLFEATPAEMEALAIKYNLNPYTVRDCMDPDHLPKYERIGEVHFLILRQFNHVFDTKIATIQDMTSKVALFYTDRYLITLHRSKVTYLDALRQKFVEPGLCQTPADLVMKICWHALETFNDPIQRLDEQIDFYETHIVLKGITYEQVEALYYIKRHASICNKVLVLTTEPINRIQALPGDDASLQDVRDQHLKMQTLHTQVLEDVNNLLNLYLSLSAQKTNDVVKVLTIFSVFFMPLTFIAGIYGMNFRYMPELEQKWAYPLVLLVMLLVAAGIYYWFKKKKWL